MKKSLLALALLGAFAGVAQAQQSNVTLYGSIDAGIRSSEARVSATNANTQRTLALRSGTYQSSRLGFRGLENIGGGLKGRFVLEHRFNTDTGTATNANTFWLGNSYVGVGGNWGFVDLGRQYTPVFEVIGTYDPLNYKYSSILPPIARQSALGIVRFDNSIKYSGDFGPVKFGIAHSFGERPGDTGSGAGTAIGARFATGPFAVGAAALTRANAADTADREVWTVGGAFKTGPLRVAVGYIDADSDAGFVPATATAAASGATDNRTAWVGASYALSPALSLATGFYRVEDEVGATETRTNQGIISATYALSKRTNFYAAYDASKRLGGNNERLDNASIGINHLF